MLLVRKASKQRKRQRGEHFRFAARVDDGQPRAMMNEQPRGRSCGRDGDTHSQPAIGGGPPQLRRNRPGIPKQPLEAA